MKRLFTFGCSFTRYHWPTWADIIAKDFDHYENWGMSGGGNHYIFNSIVECNHRHKFSKNDTVIIMWTNIARDDRYIQDRWVCPGNIFHPNKNNKDILKSKIVCTRGFLIRDLAYISAAISLLENQNVKFEMHSMMPLVVIDQYEKVMIEDTNIDDVVSLYNNTLQMIKSNVYEKIFNSNWSSKTTEFLSEANITKAYSTNKDNIFLEWLFNQRMYKRPDIHPSPQEHLEYSEKFFSNFYISDKTKEWINSYKLGDKFSLFDPTSRL